MTDNEGGRLKSIQTLISYLIEWNSQSPQQSYLAFADTLSIFARRPRPQLLCDLAALMPFILALAGDDGRGMVWPESMPPEILAEVEREAGRRGPVPLSAVADLEDDYDDYDDEDDDADERHAKGRPGNVIRLQPKLSALQGGLSPQAKPSPSTAPRPASVPAPPAPGTDGGVRERDTLELLELGSLPEDDSPSSTDEAPSAPEHASKAARSSRKGKRDAAPPPNWTSCLAR